MGDLYNFLRNSIASTIQELNIPVPPTKLKWNNCIDGEECPLINDIEESGQDGDAHEECERPIDRRIHHLTTLGKHGLTVLELYDVPDIPLYPSTSIEGIGYRINVEGLSMHEVKGLITRLQYSHTSKNSIHDKPTFSSLLNVPVQRTIIKCSGVKVCSFASNYVKQSHIQWGYQDFLKKQEATYSSQRIFAEEFNCFVGQKRTIDEYNAIMNRFRIGGLGCPYFFHRLDGTDEACQGKPRVFRFEHMNLNDEYEYFVGCEFHNVETRKYHYFRKISTLTQVNSQYLGDLLLNSFHSHEEECFRVVPMISRLKDCGVPHASGPQKLIALRCNVQFNLLIPQDLVKTPYILFSSSGIHTHNAPPPLSTPRMLQEHFIQELQKLVKAGLTSTQVLNSSIMRDFTNRLGVERLSDTHPSFHNKSKIQALIHNEVLKRYPAGVDWSGVWAEYLLHHKDKGELQYIRTMVTDGINRLIPCITLEQARHLKKQKTFQVDMSFKRVYGDWKEIIFATFLQESEQLLVLARIFINVDTSNGYYQAFTAIFSCINKALANKGESEIQWSHIHGQGIQAIIVDMCAKQAHGWGSYLSSIDPEHRPWQWHVKRTLIYCTIHYKRGLNDCVRSGKLGNDLRPYQVLCELLTLETKREALQTLDFIEIKFPKMKDWCQHKRCDWIISGLNCDAWEGEKATFLQSPRNSNTVESSNAQSNRLGTSQSLMAALIEYNSEAILKTFSSRLLSVNSGMEHDLRELARIRDRGLYGSQIAYRKRNILVRLEEATTRSLSKTRKKLVPLISESEGNLLLDTVGLQSFTSVNSSGKPIKRRKESTQENQLEDKKRSIELRLLEIELEHKEIDLRERKAKAR